MALKYWIKDGKKVVNAEGKAILCDHCPCADPCANPSLWRVTVTISGAVMCGSGDPAEFHGGEPLNDTFVLEYDGAMWSVLVGSGIIMFECAGAVKRLSAYASAEDLLFYSEAAGNPFINANTCDDGTAIDGVATAFFSPV